MLNLFRKKRDKSLKENNVRKYVKYAFGEIILVMVGILLALQVNTWNEKRKGRIKEKAILSQLNKEFSKNLASFIPIKEAQLRTFNSGQIVFRNLKKMHIPACRDSVYRYVQGMSGGYAYYPSNGVVESLISTGDINLIQNDTLRNYLVSWKDELKNYTERVNIDITLWSHTLEPYIINHGNLVDLKSEENFKLVEDRVFINILFRQQHYNRNIVSAIQNENSIENYMKEIIRLSEAKK
ncbi:DUF6090 family protein [Kordia sp.]|uniref:DUF6090 family protein n=1 Tax=Kordia sp. TaxID=1965332 RepID=UPI003D6BE183